MVQTSTTPAAAEANNFVAKTATKPDELPLHELSLLGVAGKPDAMTALLRTASGRIITTTTGKQTVAGRVLAITAEGVVLQRAGETVRLDSPIIG